MLAQSLEGMFFPRLPHGVDVTLAELQEMALRQQQQIDAQQQMLLAKEQRLKFLKQQELRHQQVAAEQDRVRALRDKVESQELKLRRLRALRGQVNEHKGVNNNLSAELDQIKSLFGEKEKELSLAVNKVDELTKQLEDIRQGRLNGYNVDSKMTTPALIELEKLRKELLARNKMNEQQNSKLAAQREILLQRKEEMSMLDSRIAELQTRIRKKRIANNDLYNQLRAGGAGKTGSRPLSANIAAVEPYIKHDPKQHVFSQQDINKNITDKQYGLNKQDPKYQTLPYNIKFPGGVNNNDNQHSGNKNDTYENKGEADKGKNDTSQTKMGSALAYLPKEVIHNAPDFRPSVGHATAFEAMQDTLKDSQLPLTTPSKNVFGGYKPGSSLSNFTPRPFGSTYSTSSIVTTRPSIGTTTPQNSPGNNTTLSSSFGFQGIPGYPKTSTPLAPAEHAARSVNDDSREIMITGGPRNESTIRNESPSAGAALQPGQVPPLNVVTSSAGVQGSQPSHSPVTAPPVYQVATSRVQQPMQPQHTVSPQLPPSSASNTGPAQKGLPTATNPQGAPPPYGYHRNLQTQPVSDPPSSTNSRSTDQYPGGRSFGSASSQNDVKSAPTKDPASASHRLGIHNADAKSGVKDHDVSSALSVLKSGPITTSVNTKPSYRYAPKSVIANTYMRRLGPEALDQYRKNMNQLYSQLLPGQTGVLGAAAQAPSSPTAKVEPLSVESEPKASARPNQSPTKDSEHEHSGSQDSSEGSDPPGYRNAPPHDMDVERMRYQTNAPKLRRRLSSGESDFSHHRNTSQGDTSNSATHDLSKRNESTAKEKVTENVEADTTPEIVRLDDLEDSYNNNKVDDPFDKAIIPLSEAERESSPEEPREGEPHARDNLPVALRRKKGNLRTGESAKHSRRVSFDPLALLLDASLEGELALVKRTAKEVSDPSASNDEGITALHNAICAGHFEIVKFLVEFGCNVNSPDSDGWTPLHCAASCNNLPMVKLLVEHGACIFATTISDHETAAEKCEEDEDGYDGCSEYLYSIQEKLGIINKGVVYAVFSYTAQRGDELHFTDGDCLQVLRKGDETERDWWWTRLGDREGYVPRNLLGLYPRIKLQSQKE